MNHNPENQCEANINFQTISWGSFGFSSKPEELAVEVVIINCEKCFLRAEFQVEGISTHEAKNEGRKQAIQFIAQNCGRWDSFENFANSKSVNL